MSVADSGKRRVSAESFVTLHEIMEAAHDNLEQHLWDYLVGAAESETTMRRNRHALNRLALRQRVLRNVANVDMTTDFFGHRLRLPVALAPIGGLESFDPGGGRTVAQAGRDFGVATLLSSVCQPGLEAVAEVEGGCKIFQLYVRGGDAWVDDHVERAMKHGYAIFCITVDTAHYSRRERDLANRFVKPWRTRATGMEAQASFTWKNVERLRRTFPDVRFMLKGIGTPEDAAIAAGLGIDAVYVSNHGGRQLDHTEGSMDVLPQIVRAVHGRAKVVVDGGVLRGTDVLKAIAAGADLVGIGRLHVMGLAAAGEAGLLRVLELLEEEIRTSMGLMGAASIAEVDHTWLAEAPAVSEPDYRGAYPMLDVRAQRYRRWMED